MSFLSKNQAPDDETIKEAKYPTTSSSTAMTKICLSKDPSTELDETVKEQKCSATLAGTATAALNTTGGTEAKLHAHFVQKFLCAISQEQQRYQIAR